MTICFVLQISLFIISTMSAFPTADRHAARRAYLDALRAADGLPPITGRPVLAGPAPPVAQNEVVSLTYFSYLLPCTYELICCVFTCLYVVYIFTSV